MSGLVDFLINPGLDRTRAYGPELQAIQSVAAARQAMRSIAKWPGYAPTPLIAEIAVATPTKGARKAPTGMIRLTRATEVVLHGERVQFDAGTPLRVESAAAGMVNVRVGLEVIAIPAVNTDYGSP